MDQNFNLLADPRSSASWQDLKDQFDFLIEVRNKLTEAHTIIKQIRKLNTQLKSYQSRIQDNEALKDLAELIKNTINKAETIEQTLYQTKNRSRQDPLNYPIRLTNKLAHLVSLTSNGNNKPTKQAYKFKKELTADIDTQLKSWYVLKDNDLSKINKFIKEKNIEAIIIE